MRYKSPLRYPGGKAALAAYVGAIFDLNGLNDGHYAEPYAGGAGVALSLLYDERASHAHINDLDRSVYAFWYAALHHTERLCRMVRDTPVTVDEWHRQRLVQQRKRSVSLLTLGFSTFFLNRTNRSGIIASGGVIGGQQQSGTWGIDARYNGRELVRRLERVAEFRDRITLTQLDADDFLRQVSGVLPARGLVYLDPPYYVKGQRRLYANYYGPDDHAHIAKALASAPWPWIVSYDAAPEILQLYRRYRCVRYALQYSATARHTGQEAIFLAPGLKAPKGAPIEPHRGRRLAAAD
ncbi:MAG: DNA adenine methylase [Gemmatimonadales bacterium]